MSGCKFVDEYMYVYCINRKKNQFHLVEKINHSKNFPVSRILKQLNLKTPIKSVN